MPLTYYWKPEADPNIADKNGNTCLMCVVDGECSNDVLKTIIDHGADVNVTDKQKRSALMVACLKRNVDSINVLLRIGSDTNITDISGNTSHACC